MNIDDVDKILNTFHNGDYTDNYLYQNLWWKQNTWLPISNLPEFNFVHELIYRDVSRELNDNYEIGFITLLIYNKGDFFKEHIDFNENYDFKHDTIMTGYYLLNTDFSGGKFYLKNIEIESNIGKLVTFNRNDIHEVSEITDGNRYSLHFPLNKLHIKSVI